MQIRRVTSIAAVAAVVLHAPAHAQGLFDRLKSEMRRAVEDTVEDIAEGAGSKADSPDAPTGNQASAGTASAGGPPADGRWQGQLVPEGKKSIAAFGSVEIVLAGDVGMLRYESTTPCLAELDGTAGQYAATFVTGQNICGTRASVSLAGDGGVRLTWEDAPNTPADERTYAGSLRLLQPAWARDEWSVSADERARYDVIGYGLGMSYEAALAHIADDPDMQHQWQAIVTADGKGTVSPVEKLTKGQGSGIAFTGDTLMLQFEAQTAAEMEVEPGSRPRGADAELLVIHRAITFTRDARPNVDNVTAALVDKYGEPSIRTENRQDLEWVFDPSGKRIADAANGPCDQATPAGKQNKSTLTPYYGPIPGWVSPECGLTVVAELRYEQDGGLYRMSVTVFDQRRLLGDGWYQTLERNRAQLADEKAALEATKAVAAPAL